MTWGHLHDHVEVGIIHRTLYPESKETEALLLKTIDAIIQDPFFDRVELPPIKDEMIREKLKQKCHIAKIKVTYATSPRVFAENLNINSCDERERVRAVRALQACMADASEFGVDRLTFISGPKNPLFIEEEKKALLKSVIELSETADHYHLPFHLELHATEIDKKRFMGSTRDALEISKNLHERAKMFSFLIDLSHFPLLGESIEESVLPLGSDIGYVHVGNCVVDRKDERFGDTHPYFGYPNGVNDVVELAQFFKALHKVGYVRQSGGRAPITVETIRWGDEAVGDLIANAKRTLNQAWSLFKQEV